MVTADSPTLKRLDLRPYQIDAYARTRAAFLAGATAALLVLPTGAGKTLTLSEFIRRAEAKGHAIEFFAHREELLEQARACFRRQGIPLTHVRVMSTQSGLGDVDHAHVAGRPVRLRIFDEAHHYSADKWGALAAPSPGVAIIGATATPQRGDGRGLGRGSGGPFDVLIEVVTVRELQALGVLVPVLTYAPSKGVDSKDISVDNVVAAHLSRAPGRRTIVYRSGISGERGVEAQAMAFTRAGVRATFVTGEMDSNIRRARIDAFRTQTAAPLLFAQQMEGAPLVIVNDQLLTEGLDVIEIECIILGRNVGDRGAMKQIVGRGMRAAPGKERMVFVDLPGVTRRRDKHGRLKIGLPEDRDAWSLDGKPSEVADEDAERPLHTCPACEATISSWRTGHDGWRCCPLCRERVTPPPPPGSIIARELHAYGSGAPLADREKELRRLARKCIQNGYRPSWIAYRYAEAFACAEPFDIAEEAHADAVRDRGRPAQRRGVRAA